MVWIEENEDNESNFNKCLKMYKTLNLEILIDKGFLVLSEN